MLLLLLLSCVLFLLFHDVFTLSSPPLSNVVVVVVGFDERTPLLGGGALSLDCIFFCCCCCFVVGIPSWGESHCCSVFHNLGSELVECRPSAEPGDLGCVHRVVEWDLKRRGTRRGLHVQDDLLARGELVEVEEADAVVSGDLVVVGGVGERQCQQSLLLQVRLVDAGKAARDDRPGAQVARLEGRLLAAAPLPIVRVANDHPAQPRSLVRSRRRRNGSPLPGQLVLHQVRLAIRVVDGGQQEVVRDVVEVPTELEPRPCLGDVIRRACGGGGNAEGGEGERSERDVVEGNRRRD